MGGDGADGVGSVWVGPPRLNGFDVDPPPGIDGGLTHIACFDCFHPEYPVGVWIDRSHTSGSVLITFDKDLSTLRPLGHTSSREVFDTCEARRIELKDVVRVVDPVHYEQLSVEIYYAIVDALLAPWR